ncbi:aldehyde dehydrogenase (NADP(+)) [Teredinibacter turnerae]|uniref:aldehyde dehydrogenase (NADP(+)) n=1 Tax=Teredinibacter turnerae TaxID=2426 RepID=UPI000361EB4B|nr:aldehyde dehydrogenase (NADP(+)) [Teredinibacter turnerae]
MATTGKLLINGHWVTGENGHFQAYNPTTGAPLAQAYSFASANQVQQTALAAGKAFNAYAGTSPQLRAELLRTCAVEIEHLGEELLTTMAAETGYSRERCESERARTTYQLRLYAETLDSGDYLDARICTAQPHRTPAPRPDIRYVNQPLGVVAVFAVSNFPLAYSTAGGDTCSALAAGCSVIVKGHCSHPGTGELVAQAIGAAVKRCGLPAAIFSFLQGEDDIAGTALIEAPQVKAIGFTGSQKGGMAISKIAAQRPEPIPVFAEMGSVNPVFILPEKMNGSAEALADAFIDSLTLGNGQMCVCPGIVVANKGESLERFKARCTERVNKITAQPMLNKATATQFCTATTRAQALAGVSRLDSNTNATESTHGFYGAATVLSTDLTTFVNADDLHHELFGPAAVIVATENTAQFETALAQLGGQLTATLHGSDAELEHHAELIQQLTAKAGRIVINGFPTGVEVCEAMVHGGPFPASSDSRFTAVGTASIQRFLRPVCYQDVPDKLLPEPLKNSNPLRITRLLNGEKTSSPVKPE